MIERLLDVIALTLLLVTTVAVGAELDPRIGRVESGRPVTTATLFQAASISKPISAVGVLALVQRRRLDLNENVNRERGQH